MTKTEEAWTALLLAERGFVKECSESNFRNSWTDIIKRFNLCTSHTTGWPHCSRKQHAESSLLEIIQDIRNINRQAHYNQMQRMTTYIIINNWKVPKSIILDTLNGTMCNWELPFSRTRFSHDITQKHRHKFSKR